MLREIEALLQAYEAESRAEGEMIHRLLNTIYHNTASRQAMMADMANAINRAAHTAATPPSPPPPPPPNSVPTEDLSAALGAYPWEAHRGQLPNQ